MVHCQSPHLSRLSEALCDLYVPWVEQSPPLKQVAPQLQVLQSFEFCFRVLAHASPLEQHRNIQHYDVKLSPGQRRLA